jgi:hypothetical protein
MSPREDAWTRIGLLLGMLQHAEHAINVSLSWVFTDRPVSLEEIAFFEKSKQKKALGVLLRALRERVNIDSQFDAFLTRFLQDRNRFVHHLFTERGFSINETKDVPRIRKFVDSLAHRTAIVISVFHAFIEIWAEEHDLLDDQPDAFKGTPAPLPRQWVDYFKRHITQYRSASKN